VHDAYEGVTGADIRADEAIHRVERLEQIVQVIADHVGVDLDYLWDPEKYQPVDNRSYEEIMAASAKAMENLFVTAFLPDHMRPPKRPTVQKTMGYGVRQRSLPPSHWIHTYNGETATMQDEGAIDALYKQYELDLEQWKKKG
jgi:hypothetical protein